MQKVTLAECEYQYKAALKKFQQYLEQTGKAEFGTLNKAAAATFRSRAHLFDCIEGRRDLDSVRRLAISLDDAVKQKRKAQTA